jgi:hypothetical protein
MWVTSPDKFQTSALRQVPFDRPRPSGDCAERGQDPKVSLQLPGAGRLFSCAELAGRVVMAQQSRHNPASWLPLRPPLQIPPPTRSFKA